MNCPNCAAVMVTARATNFGSEYFYCRPCKKELAEMVTLEARVPEPETFSGALKNYFTNSNGNITVRPGTYNNNPWGYRQSYDPSTPITLGGGGNNWTSQCGDPGCECMAAADPDDSSTADLRVRYSLPDTSSAMRMFFDGDMGVQAQLERIWKESIVKGSYIQILRMR